MKSILNKNILGLIINNSFHSIINIYMNTFLVAYILNINSGNFFNIALYYLITYAVMIIAYTLFSFIVCKVNKTHMVRLSVVFQCIILASMALLQGEIVNYIAPVAVIYSISNAMYWSSLNALSNTVIKGKLLQNYNTYNSVIGGLTSILIPITFGSIIDSSSFFVISVFATIVGVGQIIATLFIDDPDITNKKLDFSGYFNNCYNAGHKKCYNLLFLSYIIYGCRDAISVLITMLIVLAFQTNTSLGAISSLISLLTMLILIVTNKKHTNKQSVTLFSSITAITIISMILLIFNINKAAIIFFNICYSSLLAVVNRSFNVKRSGLIRAVDKKKYIVEHQAVTEFCLNVGRVGFYSVLLLASFTTKIWVYQMLVGLGVIFIAIYGIFACLLEKEYNKILIEREFKKQQAKSEDIHGLIPCYSNPNQDTF